MRVIVAPDPPSMQAAVRVTRVVRIVARFSDDPIEAHLVESLARPGGNLTGVTSISVELYSKRLELLKEALQSRIEYRSVSQGSASTSRGSRSS